MKTKKKDIFGGMKWWQALIIGIGFSWPFWVIMASM